VQPQPQTVFVKAPSNGLATAALVLGIVGAVLSFIPLIGGLGAIIGGIGIALAIAGFLVARKRGVGKGKSIAGFILGVASIVIFFAVTVATVAVVDSAVEEIDQEIQKEIQKTEKDASRGGASFEDGVLTTPELKIQITRHKIIEVGQKGNEYGNKPVIAFWYKTTNLTDADVSPMDFLYYFTAYQDNNPNAENEIGVASLPDDRFLDTQTENIKKGGTVENAMAYELDDLVTPVDLVATEGLDDVIGKATYKLK
jgi:hypothetical protein